MSKQLAEIEKNLDEMEENKVKELSLELRNKAIKELENSAQMIKDGKSLHSTLVKVQGMGSEFTNQMYSIRSFIYFTRHLSGIFGIDFDFLIDSVCHYSSEYEIHSEYDNNEESYHTEYLVDINSDVNVHLSNDEVLTINVKRMDEIINQVAPELILRSFKSNNDLLDIMDGEDFDRVRKKFSKAYSELLKGSDAEITALNLDHGNMITMASYCVRMSKLEKSYPYSFEFDLSPDGTISNKEKKVKLRSEIAMEHITDIENLYRDLIYELYSFKCEFNILSYININTMVGDKLPLMRAVLRELVGESYYNKIKFLDRKFYMKLNLKVQGLNTHSVSHVSYTSILRELYQNNELLLPQFITNYIISADLIDVSGYKHLGKSNIFKFSKDGNH